MPLVAPDHVESGTGRLLRLQTAKEQGAISGKYLFEPNDVIYSKIRPYLKKAIIVDFAGLCSADMYALRAGENITPSFLFATVLGEQFSRFAESVSMRSGIPKINREEFSEYCLPLPPLSEQTKISDAIVSMDRRITDKWAYLSKLFCLKKALMQVLLTGKVRVKA
jgi:type I restriction enzyme S subunit